MKVYSSLLLIGAFLFMGQPSLAATTSPIFDEAALDDLAIKNPEAYEIYRKHQADNAKSYEEFLNWATPAEIAEDLGIDVNAAVPVQNVRSAIVRININFKADYSDYLTMTSPQGVVKGKVRGARAGYGVPHGCYVPLREEENHWSHKWKAWMPNAVIFTSGVAALHAGSLSVGSHGCVHESWDLSVKVYNTVAAYGTANTLICIQ